MLHALKADARGPANFAAAPVGDVSSGRVSHRSPMRSPSNSDEMITFDKPKHQETVAGRLRVYEREREREREREGERGQMRGPAVLTL